MNIGDLVEWAAHVASNKKSFSDRVIGGVSQNRYGLHCARILVSDTMHGRELRGAKRKTGRIPNEVSRLLTPLRRDGLVVVPNYLPQEQFATIREECERRVAQMHDAVPVQTNLKPGTGHCRKFPGGIDRYDGATTNRFIDLDERHTPNTRALAKSSMFRPFRRLLVNDPRPLPLSLYENIHGDESLNHDVQKDIHRDTFHHTYKVWFYLRDVELEDGPFQYSIGSHRLGLRRLGWEYAQSNVAAGALDKEGRGGAFRATPAALLEMGHNSVQPILAKANTLVIADTRGFHCRGPARPDARRLSLYATLRPQAFAGLERWLKQHVTT